MFLKSPLPESISPANNIFLLQLDTVKIYNLLFNIRVILVLELDVTSQLVKSDPLPSKGQSRVLQVM